MAGEFEVGDAHISIDLNKVADFGYGINPHQPASLYSDGRESGPAGLDKLELAIGIPPSTSNYFDLSRGVMAVTRAAAHMDVNYNGHIPSLTVALKHGNACGAGLSFDPYTATRKAIEGDLEDIHGATIVTTSPIDEEMADLLMRYKVEDGSPRRVLDVIAAPAVTDEAINKLERKKTGKLRILTNPALAYLGRNTMLTAPTVHSFAGITVVEAANRFVPNPRDPAQEMQLFDEPVAADFELSSDMLLAEAVGSSSTSNTITLIEDGRLIGNGVGQKARHKAASLALAGAAYNGHNTQGATAYSDSFFPLPDGVEMLVDAGVTDIFTMRGSENDARVMDAIRNRNVRFINLPVKVSRGFLH